MCICGEFAFTIKVKRIARMKRMGWHFYDLGYGLCCGSDKYTQARKYRVVS